MMNFRLSLVWCLLIGFLATVGLAGCVSEDSPAQERAERARDASGPIVVGAAWPWEDMKGTLYLQGMQMAVDEINARGGIMDRQLKLVREDDQATVNEARIVAQRFANNYNMVAVIGHLQSFTTLPAAAIYDRAGLLLLAPTATDPDLTQKGYGLVFRSTFGNEGLGQQLASYVVEQGYQRVAVCYISNEYGRELANAFEDDVADRGVDVVSRQGYSAEMRGTAGNLERIVSEWVGEDIDAVFLAGEVPIAPMLMSAARNAGVTASFVGGDALRIPRVIQLGGEAVEGLVVPYRFHADEDTPDVQRFAREFEVRHGVAPDAGAALGYDSIYLLAHGITTAETTVPGEVAQALRTTTWTGVTGPYAFDENGNLSVGAVKLMQIQNQRFVPLDFVAPERLPS